MTTTDARTTATTHGSPGTRSKSSVPAIDRAVLVLDEIGKQAEPITFGALSSRLPIARSSLHNLCSSLCRAGLLSKSEDGRYEIGLKVVELAQSRLASMDIVRAFQDVVRALGPVEETIVLSVLSGPDVVYVSFIDGRRPLAVRYEIGMRLPAAFTASGKAILATLTPEQVADLLGDAVENPHVAGQRKTIDEVLGELEATRSRGYSVDDEETARGMACIGAAVFDPDHSAAVGAVAVSLVKSAARWHDSEVTDQVQDIASRISRHLGVVDRRS